MSEKSENVGLIKSFLALFSKDDKQAIKAVLDEEGAAAVAGEPNGDAADSSESRQQTPPGKTEPVTAAEVARLRADSEELTRVRQERRRETAEAFANAEVQACRAMPAERDALIAAFMQAAIDDESHPLAANYSLLIAERDGNKIFAAFSSRVDQLKAQCAARPTHKLTEEQLPAGATVLPADQPDKKSGEQADAKPVSQERRQKLLKHTTAGQAALKTIEK